MTGAARPARLVGALASGLLVVLIFPGPDLGWLAWIVLVPLLVAIDDLTPDAAFRLGYLAGLVASGGVLWWMRDFSLPAWILVCAMMAAFVGAFAAGVRLVVGTRREALLWAAPLTWVAIEVVRSVGPIGFPWGLLGLSQYQTPRVLALASIAGVFGISGLIVLVNAVIAAAVAGRRVGIATAAGALAALTALVMANVRPAPGGPAQPIVAAVQPNVSPLARSETSSASVLIAGLLRQTVEARDAGAEIIVFPETAVPADLGSATALRAAIARSAGGAIVVAGAFLPGPQNGVLVLDPQGAVAGRYAKRRLVPFGEAGVRPGREAVTVTTPAGVIGLVICYESAFPFMTRSLAAGGADLIALLTNDGWFGPSAGPAQHAAHSVLRAVETGRSVVRAANTGTSMLIRSDGRIIGSLPQATAGVLVASLPVGGPPTPYVRWGWLLGPLAVAGWVAAAASVTGVALRRRWPAAWRLAAAVIVPAVPWLLGRRFTPDGGPLPWPAVLGVLAAMVAVGRGHLFDRRGVWISGAVSLAGTGLLLWAMRAGYAQYGFQMPIGPPAAGWGWGGLHLVAGGMALELWLRGAVFSAAAQVGGWVLGTILSTALSVLLHSGALQEIVFWHLVTGLGFSLLRARTGDAAGLGVARGLGDAAVMSLAGLR